MSVIMWGIWLWVIAAWK